MREAGEDVARRYVEAVEASLKSLCEQPDLGRIRRFRDPRLRDVRSFAVQRPFDKLLIFYRTNEAILQAWRLMHGARDLPKRLIEPAGGPELEHSNPQPQTSP